MSAPLVPTGSSPPEVPHFPSAAGQRERFAQAYSLLAQAIRDRAFPGAAFSVLSGKEIVVLDGAGRFTYQPEAPLVTASTIYDLASVTKVLATTSMAMLLYQRQLLSLDEPIVVWLPGFAEDSAAGRRRHEVTVRMLLAHTSGLPGYARLYETCGARCPDRETVLSACLKVPLEADPGTRVEYSDLGFILLGQILETIAGESIASFCAREIFQPLGMESTCFLPPASWRPAIAPTEDDLAWRRRVLKGEVQDENCFALGGVSGHAGLFSNALDPLRYAKCLLGQPAGPFSEHRAPFLPETIAAFTARIEQPPGSSRALGFDTPSQPSSSGRFFSRYSAGHLGYAGTSLWIDFEREIAVVLLTNRTWPHRGNEAIRRIRPAFHDAIANGISAIPPVS